MKGHEHEDEKKTRYGGDRTLVITRGSLSHATKGAGWPKMIRLITVTGACESIE